MDGGVLAALGLAHDGGATGPRQRGAERAPRRRREASAEREAGRGDGGGRGRRRRGRGDGDGDGEAGGHRGGWMGTGVSGWEGGGVGKPGAVREGKVVGRELEWSRAGLEERVRNSGGVVGRTDKYRSARRPRRGTCGSAVCCRCGRAIRDSFVAIRPDEDRALDYPQL